MKKINVVIAAIGLIFLAYFVACGISSLSHGYSWSEMDWNQDGTTSISEFFAASDIGKRSVISAGKECIEYFAYKDGLPVKVVCPPSN